MSPYRQPALLPAPPSFRLTPAARRWVRIRQWACGKWGHIRCEVHLDHPCNEVPVCRRCGLSLAGSAARMVWLRRRSERETRTIAGACRISEEVRALTFDHAAMIERMVESRRALDELQDVAQAAAEIVASHLSQRKEPQ